ncbi:MAG: hypothetical protein ACFCD0_18790 [Gemmataceae bacterium]
MKPISGFLDECCLLARNARFPAVELYLTYVHWCLESGIPVQDQFAFLDMLECRGLKYREKKNQSWFKGISVLPAYRMIQE